jgi:hypothetical protein
VIINSIHKKKSSWGRLLKSTVPWSLSAKEKIGIEFWKLLEDVSGYSERDQKMLPEVAKMLGVKVENINDAWQMNYALFQAILKFQKEHNMKLTGMVDEEGILYQAIKKHSEEKKTTPPEVPENTDNTTQPAPETEQIPPPPIPSSIPRATPINSEQENTVQQHEGQDERSSMPTPPNSPVPSAPETTAPTSPVQPTSTPSWTAETKPEVRALPVEEAAQKTAEVEQVITEEAKKLWITIDDINLAKSPLGQSIVDMILYYEWLNGVRQPDVGGYDIWAGFNTGSNPKELQYALWENYGTWIDSYIPKPTSKEEADIIQESVQRLLQSRIAVTRKSCADKWIAFDELPQNVKGVLVDLHYNMPNNINGFKKFWRAIKDKKWDVAWRELLVDKSGTGPSFYANQVQGRAYANALMLTNGDAKFKEYKQEGEKIGGGAALLSAFNNRGSKTITKKEVKEVLETIKTAEELLAITTSAEVLSSKRLLGDKGSTNAIIELINGFRIKNPAEAERLKGMLEAKIGNYSRPLQTPEDIGAFQQLVYLTDLEVFKKLEYIDGINGPRTQQAFLTMSKV